MFSSLSEIPAPFDPASTQPDPWLSLDRQLCFALYAASLAMTKRYKALLQPLNLTYPQYLVMLVLWEGQGREEPFTVTELGLRLSLDSGTLTPLLKRLQTSGLVQRQRSLIDERKLCVALTAAGLALQGRAGEVPRQVLAATQCGLAEVTRLTQQLHALRDHLVQDAS
jgi:DNA-binding MarR family transcriptional regulator